MKDELEISEILCKKAKQTSGESEERFRLLYENVPIPDIAPEAVSRFTVKPGGKQKKLKQAYSSFEYIELSKRKWLYEDALREIHDYVHFLADVLEFSSQPFALDYPDGRIITCNRAFCKLTGYTKEEVKKMTWTVLTPPDWREHEAEVQEQLRRTRQPQRYEKECIRKDGSRVPIELYTHQVYDSEGNVKYHYSFITDITERKQADEVLKRYQLLFEHARDIILFMRRDGGIIEANMAAAAAYGYDRDELLSLGIHDLRIPDDPSKIAPLMEQAGSKGILFETVHRRKDGSVFPVEVSSQGVMIGGERIILSVIRDITERRMAEEKLRVTHQQLLDIIEFLPDATFVIDRDKKVIAWNRATEEMTGLRKEDIIGKGDYAYAVPFYGRPRPIMIDLIGLDDRETELQYKYVERKGDSLYSENFISSVFEGKGAYLWAKASPLFDGDGNLVGAIESIRDITQRRRMENELRRHRDHLEELVKERTNELKTTNALLELFSRKHSRKEYLDSVVELIRNWSGCRNVGIRVLNEQGIIPYESYVGFSREFWKSENWLSVRQDQCACVRIITGKPEPQDAPVMTKAGSFFCNNIIKFVGELPEERQTRFRGACVSSGYASVAVVPMSYQGNVLGAIHLADEDEEKVPLQVVEFIESMAPLVGEALHRFHLEEELRRNYDTQIVVNSILSLSLEDIPLDELLKRAFELVLSIPWFAFESRGGIFLIEDESEVLVMKAQNGLAESIRKNCARVPLGRCLCGRAALMREVQYADCIDHCHEIRFEGFAPHGHCCVPIVSAGRILGVMNLHLREGHRRHQREEAFLTAIADTLAGVIMRKRVEEALRFSEERFSKAFNTSPGPIAIVALSDGRIIDVNDSFLRITGYRREEVAGRTTEDLNIWADPEDCTKVRRMILEQGAFNNLELKFCTKSGKERIGLSSAEIINLTSEQCVLCVIQDITERKQLEKEMARLDRLNLVGQMAAGIGHEIRNPMTTVRGFLQMLGSKKECMQYKEYYDLMIEELDRANSIITEFLSLARNKSIDLNAHNLNSIIEVLSPLIQADAMVTSNDLKVRLEHIPDLLLDEKEIRQLILNLVRNGLEAMSPGGNLTIRTFADGEEIVLSVQDTGKGIDPNVIEKIGTPFFTTKEQGTGLGLAVCYSIAARHNADIKFKTGPTGTTFFVKFKV